VRKIERDVKMESKVGEDRLDHQLVIISLVTILVVPRGSQCALL